jgi:hypothetical protein
VHTISLSWKTNIEVPKDFPKRKATWTLCVIFAVGEQIGKSILYLPLIVLMVHAIVKTKTMVGIILTKIHCYFLLLLFPLRFLFFLILLLIDE